MVYPTSPALVEASKKNIKLFETLFFRRRVELERLSEAFEVCIGAESGNWDHGKRRNGRLPRADFI